MTHVLWSMIVSQGQPGRDARAQWAVMLPDSLVDRHQSLVACAGPGGMNADHIAHEVIHGCEHRGHGRAVRHDLGAAGAPHPVGRLGEFPNPLVMCTLSKLELARLRLGCLAGPPPWLEAFHKMRMSYNINILTQIIATFALTRGRAVLWEWTANLRAKRERMFRALEGMEGLTPFSSEASFILVRARPGEARRLIEGLKAGGVLAKLLHGSHPLLEDCLRLAVGTPEESRQLLALLEEQLRG